MNENGEAGRASPFSFGRARRCGAARKQVEAETQTESEKRQCVGAAVRYLDVSEREQL
jgi:hypothetical protein